MPQAVKKIKKAVASKKVASTNKASLTKKKKVKSSSILKYLPESLEHIDLVQKLAVVLEDLSGRVSDVKLEANKELKKLMKLYEGNYQNLEKKVHEATSEAKKQAQVSMIQLMQKWHEHKEKLPAPLTKEIEKLISQIGAKATRKTTRSSTVKAPKKDGNAKKM